jgi:hypothetical protein
MLLGFTWDDRWINFVPAFLALLVKTRIPQLSDRDEWKTPCSFNALENYDFLIQAYPMCFTIFSAPPFIFWLLSVLVPDSQEKDRASSFQRRDQLQ